LIPKLRNLGKASFRMLEAAGLRSKDRLRAMGSVAAFAAVKRAGNTPSLNLLWALEGALTDRDWKEVARKDRTSLLILLHDHEKSRKWIQQGRALPSVTVLR
jgi:DNA transformation protein and related proteins